jgi:hypothetical protein
MSSFLDKAKEKAQQIAGQAKDKVEDVQNRHRADDLLDDIGRIIYRQRTDGPLPDDDARISELVVELKALADAGTPVLDDKDDRSGALPPPATPSTLPPPTL